MHRLMGCRPACSRGHQLQFMNDRGSGVIMASPGAPHTQPSHPQPGPPPICAHTHRS